MCWFSRSSPQRHRSSKTKPDESSGNRRGQWAAFFRRADGWADELGKKAKSTLCNRRATAATLAGHIRISKFCELWHVYNWCSIRTNRRTPIDAHRKQTPRRREVSQSPHFSVDLSVFYAMYWKLQSGRLLRCHINSNKAHTTYNASSWMDCEMLMI